MIMIMIMIMMMMVMVMIMMISTTIKNWSIQKSALSHLFLSKAF